MANNPKSNKAPSYLASVENEIQRCDSIQQLSQLLQKTSKKPVNKEILAKITQKLLAWTHHDDNLNLSLDAFNLLKSIQEYCGKHNIDYPKFVENLNKILQDYHTRIKQKIIQGDDELNQSIEKFFYLYDHHPLIQSFKSESKNNDITRFGKRSQISKIITELNDLHQKYHEITKNHEVLYRQRAYSELLNDILEGRRSTASVIPILESQKIDLQSSRELLPESEYPVPNAEPEHPDYIGFNRTMDFNPEIANKISELFSTKDLQADYLDAFPWGININTANRLELAYFDPAFDLINSDISISLDLQYIIMSYTLLSLDTISKLAGANGELSLENFGHIKKITESLSKIAELTNDPNKFELDTTSSYVLSLLYKLYKQNQQLQKYTTQFNSPLEVQANPEMNGFCHLNEHLINILCGKEYQQSTLAPGVPDPDTQQIISQYINYTTSKNTDINPTSQEVTDTMSSDNTPQPDNVSPHTTHVAESEIKAKHFENTIKDIKTYHPPMIKRSIEQVRKKLRSQ